MALLNWTLQERKTLRDGANALLNKGVARVMKDSTNPNAMVLNQLDQQGRLLQANRLLNQKQFEMSLKDHINDWQSAIGNTHRLMQISGIADEAAQLRMMNEVQDQYQATIDSELNNFQINQANISVQEDANTQSKIQAAASGIIAEKADELVKTNKASRDFGRDTGRFFTGMATGALSALGIGGIAKGLFNFSTGKLVANTAVKNPGAFISGLNATVPEGVELASKQGRSWLKNLAKTGLQTATENTTNVLKNLGKTGLAKSADIAKKVTMFGGGSSATSILGKLARSWGLYAAIAGGLTGGLLTLTKQSYHLNNKDLENLRNDADWANLQELSNNSLTAEDVNEYLKGQLY